MTDRDHDIAAAVESSGREAELKVTSGPAQEFGRLSLNVTSGFLKTFKALFRPRPAGRGVNERTTIAFPPSDDAVRALLDGPDASIKLQEIWHYLKKRQRTIVTRLSSGEQISGLDAWNESAHCIDRQIDWWNLGVRGLVTSAEPGGMIGPGQYRRKDGNLLVLTELGERVVAEALGLNILDATQ